VTWAFLTVQQRFADVRERPDRPVGHGKADAPRPSITCFKARLGEAVTCQVGGAAQVEGAVALSVVVRSGPIMTAVNGTVVARPEDNLGMPVAAGSTLTIG
jgi:hypothetical protein